MGENSWIGFGFGDVAIFCHFFRFVLKNIFFTFIDLH